MLTEKLKEFVSRVEQLPPSEQEQLIEEIEDALDNAQWRALINDPRSGPVLDEMIARAKRSPKLPWPPDDDESTPTNSQTGEN